MKPRPAEPHVAVVRTLPQLDPGSSEPLYRQVRAHLVEAIAAGLFDAAGRPLPSSRYLAPELGVSRNTVNLAYQELIAEGIVESRPRSGLYPTDRLPRRRAGAPMATPSTDVDWRERVRSPEPADLHHVVKDVDWHRFPYPFLGGQLDVELFPVRAWLRALTDSLDPPHIHASLRDNLDQDDPVLVRSICEEVLPSRGIRASPSEVLITAGSQQGLFLIGEALLGATQVVAVENPGYLDAWHIFRRTGATLLPMPVDSCGAVLPGRYAHVDVLYLTPSHHHPTNVTLSLERRQQVLEQAARRDAVVIEDDYDSEFRYQGRPTPALKAIDRSGRVVYLGTFSKFLAPGLRLGYVVADSELIRALRDRRRYVTRHPPGQLQRALALFIGSGEYLRALRRHRGLLKRKWERTSAAVAEHLPWSASPPTTGGLTLWLTGPDELDTGELARRAADHGVLVEPGEQFFLGPHRPRHHLRVGFATIPERAIPRGIEILGRVARDLLEPDATPRLPRSDQRC